MSQSQLIKLESTYSTENLERYTNTEHLNVDVIKTEEFEAEEKSVNLDNFWDSSNIIIKTKDDPVDRCNESKVVVKEEHLELYDHKRDHILDLKPTDVKEERKTAEIKNDGNLTLTTKKVMKCNLCEYSTIRSYTLRRHINSVHLKLRTLQCDWCDYDTNNAQRLIDHVKAVHMKLKEQKCHLCDFRTTTKELLKRHSDGHSEIKKFKCDLCDYATSLKFSLKKHENSVHLKLNKEKCDLCEFTATTIGHITRHVNSVHLRINKRKEHKCQFCKYTTSRNYDMKIHIEAVHSRVKTQACHLCDTVQPEKLISKDT